MFLMFILVCGLVSTNSAKNWDYTFIGIEADIKVDYFQNDLKAERIKRGDYGINGSFTLGKDLGPDNKFQANVYRSPRGNDDYKPLPFAIPKQSFDVFFNNVYKEVLMEDLHKCADIVYFEDKWDGVVKAGKYEVNMCKLSVANWPDNLMPGFYKFVMELLDERDNVIVAYTVEYEIETKLGIWK